MSIVNSLEARRSYYQINKQLPVDQAEIESKLGRITELVPDAFNMKSARLVLLLGDQHDLFWDEVYESFGGKLAREKADSFKAGAGTVLFFYDQATVEAMQEQFPRYAENFPIWANQANGMVQLAVWSGLRELGIGASLQHYNPVIDQRIKDKFQIPAEYQLLAQMPFGGIAKEPEAKPAEDISRRFRVIK